MKNIISIILIIITIAIALIVPSAVGIHSVYIDPKLVDSPAAKEIAALGIPVYIEDLGTDGNGYTVCGQTRFYNNGTIVSVVLDDDIVPNSYEANAILYHELGHIVHIIDGTTNDEAAADDYAASRGYNIVDAYHGIH